MVEQKGKSIRPEPAYVPVLPEISHGETETVAVIKGRARKINQKGEEASMVEQERVVLTPEGNAEVVAGGMGQPVTAYEAGKIADPDVMKELRKAKRRVRAARKRKEQALQKKVKKGSV